METIALSNINCKPIYTPLDHGPREIRLLRLLAGSKSLEIRCVLEHSICPEVADYEAISYCWGDPYRQKRISLNGQAFIITENAEAVLRSVRHETTDKIIWIDTLCIDQKDPKERSHQVGMMREIYENAKQTWIWLGYDDGSVGEAVEMMIYLADQMSKRVDTCGNPIEMLADYETGLFTPQQNELPPFSSSKWDSLARYFARPWFTRIWIIQEVVCSRKAFCICGEYILPWDVVKLAATEIDHSSLDTKSKREGLNAVQHAITIGMDIHKDTGLFNILCSTRDFKATDPRDKIFGILGLTKKAAASLVPDYYKSVAGVYRDVVRFILDSDKNLDVLMEINHPAAALDPDISNRFSSWTPRYDEPRTWAMFSRAYCPFQTVDRRLIVETVSSDPKTLSLGGLRIDKVATLDSILTVDMLSHAAGPLQLWNRHVSSIGSYPTGEALLRAFSLTMVAGKTIKDRSAATDPSHDADFAAYITQSGNQLENLTSEERDLLVLRAMDGNAIRYGVAVSMVTTGHRFFTTTKGYMGLCPAAAKEDDIVCILFGGTLLYIVRSEKRHFRFVGVCYVHGWMDGNSVEDQTLHHTPAEIFNFR